MSSVMTFRIALGAAVLFLILAIAAAINHFTSPVAHPAFGLKAAVVLFLVALACGIYANYNRPTRI